MSARAQALGAGCNLRVSREPTLPHGGRRFRGAVKSYPPSHRSQLPAITWPTRRRPPFSSSLHRPTLGVFPASHPESATPVRRIVLTDLDRGTVHEFRDADVRIGRDPACELPVVEAPAAAEIAGVHARLAPRPTGWCLTDERTKGGTFVNHVRLVGSDQAILRTGDVIKLGAGAGARRYRVARIETVAASRQGPPPARTDTRHEEAADVRLVAGAVGGATVATAAALAPRATNAQLAGGAAAGTVVASAAAGVAATRGRTSTGTTPQGRGTGSNGSASSATVGVAAAAGAVAGTAGVAGAVSGAGGLEQWRASRLFEAAGDTGAAKAAPAKAAGSGMWAGVAAGAVAVAGATGGYQMWRSDVDSSPRVVVAQPAGTPGAAAVAAPAGGTGGNAPSSATGATDAATAAARDAASQRLGAAAGAAGNVIADISAWYRGRRVRVSGLVVAEQGLVVTVREAVRSQAGATPDSIIVAWPHGGRHRAVPRQDASGLGVIALQGWRGQWLGTAAQGDASGTPSWTAIVGFDRDEPRPIVVAAEASAVRGADAVDVRGASERLLPGSVLVDAGGRVTGVWLGAGRAAPLVDAIRLAEP